MPVQTSDEAVRLTDYDALSLRLSCYLKGYTPEDTFILHLVPLILYYHIKSVQPEFKQFALARKLKSQFFNLFPIQSNQIENVLHLDHVTLFTKINRFTPLKSPMINRGTYLRTVSISNKIADFIDFNTGKEIQIVSLGAGNDTRVFNLLPNHPNLSYIELDVESTTRLKKLAILSSPQLSKQVESAQLQTLPTTPAEIELFDPVLHTKRYHCLPIDLRSLTEFTDPLTVPNFSCIDPSKPTLLISECCICYLQKSESNSLIKFWHQWLKSGEFLVYEPLGASPESCNSNYGEVMVRNLVFRGIEMPTLMEYGTVDAQKRRFDKLIGSDSWCRSMKWVYENEISQSELDRLAKLEILDELEELNLINSHYCLLRASFCHDDS